MAFSNPITGGQGALIRPAIKSPNYVAGVSGWSINKNGSAEFNNIVIRGGTVISGTALYYNGTPAAGNLFVSISATAGTDSFGNAYVKGVGLYGAAGTLTAKDSAGNQAFISGSLPVNGLLASLPGMYMQPVSNTGDAASIGALNPGGGGDLGLILTSPSPNTGGTPGTDFAQIFLTGPYSSSNTEITMSATITNIDTVTIQNGDIQILQGDQVNIGSSSSTAAFASKGAATTSDLISARVGADTNSRYVVNHAGEMLWGAGGGSAVDVRAYRSAVDTWKIDDANNNQINFLNGSVDQGRGPQSFVTLTSNVGFTATPNTEVAVMTVPSMTYVNGRAYRVDVWGLHNAPTADSYVLYRLRKGTGTGGTVYKDQMRVRTLNASSLNNPVNLSFYLVNTSGSDITTAVTLTGSCPVASGVFTASAGNQAATTVTDVGLATQNPGQPIS